MVMANIRMLRSSTKEILSMISRGDTIIITNRGKPCAKIVPLKTKASKKSTVSPLFGVWKNDKRTVDVKKYVRELREWRHAG